MRSPKAEQIISRITALPTPYKLSFGDIAVTVTSNVYPTGELSTFVVDCLKREDIGISPGQSIVLDYGTGTGYLAVAAGKLGAQKVVALDINPSAVECARQNASDHGFSQIIDVRQSESLSALRPGEKFDIIVAGMPFESAEVNSVLERSVYDPEFSMRSSLFNNARNILNPDGRIFTTYSKRVQDVKPIETFDNRFSYTIVREGLIKGELNFVFMIQPLELISS